MNSWTPTSLERLHWLMSQLIAENGTSHFISVEHLNRSAKAFFDSGQYRVSGDDFIAWAWLSEQGERDYLDGLLRVYDDIEYAEGKRPWLIYAKMRGRVKECLKALSCESHGHKSALFMLHKDGIPKIRRIRLI